MSLGSGLRLITWPWGLGPVFWGVGDDTILGDGDVTEGHFIRSHGVARTGLPGQPDPALSHAPD